jgi:hypothetical protein
VTGNSITEELCKVPKYNIYQGASFIQGDIGNCSAKPNVDWLLEPLYPGCSFNCQHFLFILEYLKSSGHLGDGQEALILGIICSILPNENHFSQELSNTSGSVYFFQKMIKELHNKNDKMRVLEIPCCPKGHVHYVGENESFVDCQVCGVPNGSDNETFYYFPLRDRIIHLLNSDLGIFFDYPEVIT